MRLLCLLVLWAHLLTGEAQLVVNVKTQVRQNSVVKNTSRISKSAHAVIGKKNVNLEYQERANRQSAELITVISVPKKTLPSKILDTQVTPKLARKPSQRFLLTICQADQRKTRQAILCGVLNRPYFTPDTFIYISLSSLQS